MATGREKALDLIMRFKDQASAQIETINDSLDETAESAERAQSPMSGLGMVLKAAAASAILWKAAGIAKELVMVGAQAQRTAATFDTLIGGDATDALKDLRAATRGTVSDMELMAATSQLLVMGIAETKTEAVEMTEVASQLAMAMGRDVTTAMNDWAMMMANQSIPRLDTFGISSGKVRVRIIELMEATKGLTREQAFSIAVMEEAEGALQRVGEQGDDAAGNIDKATSSWENLKSSFGETLVAGGTGDTLSWITEQTNALADHFAKIADGRPIMDAFAEDLQRQRDLGAITKAEYREMDKQFDALFRKFEWGKLTTEELNDALAELSPTSYAAASGQDALAASISTTAETMRVEMESSGAMVQAMVDTSSKGYRALRLDVENSLGGISDIIRNTSRMNTDFVATGLAEMAGVVSDHLQNLESLYQEHYDSELDAQFQFELDRIEAQSEYQAESQALIDAGRIEEAQLLATKYEQEVAQSDAAYSQQQGMLDLNLTKQRIQQQRAYIQSLADQKDDMIRSGMLLIDEYNQRHDITVTGEELITQMELAGASQRLMNEVSYGMKKAEIDRQIAEGSITSTAGMINAINAMFAEQEGDASAHLSALNNEYKTQMNALKEQMAGAGAAAFTGLGESMAIGAKGASESATRALADVARDIDTAIEAMINSVGNLAEFALPPGWRRGFAKLGKVFREGVKQVYSWLDGDAKSKLESIKKYLQPLRDLFDMLNMDLANVAPAKGAFADNLDRYLNQLKGTTGRLFDWIAEISDEAKEALPEAAEIAGAISGLFQLIGVDLSKSVPAMGNYAQRVDLYIGQLKGTTGRLFDWMMDIGDEARLALPEAAALAQSVKDLFVLIGTDLSKVVPEPGAFALRVDLYLAQLQGTSGRIFDWMQAIPRNVRKSVAKAAELAKSVKDLFSLIGPDLAKIVPAEGAFAVRLERYILQLKGVSGRLFNWMQEIDEETRADVEAAGETAGHIKELFDLLGPDLSELVPDLSGLFAGRITKYIAQLKMLAVELAKMIDGLDDEIKEMLPEAGVLAGHISSLFKMLGVDLTKVVPPVGGAIAFANKTKQYMLALEMALVGSKGNEGVMDIIGRMQERWGDAIEAAKGTLENIAAMWESIGSVASQISSIVDAGGIDVQSAQAIMAMIAELTIAHPGSTATTVSDIAGAGPINDPREQTFANAMQMLASSVPPLTDAIMSFVNDGIRITLSVDVNGQDAGDLSARVAAHERSSIDMHVAAQGI